MADWYGRWTYDPDNHNEDDWCDMDYVAHWMFDEMGYKPSMDLYTFIQRLIDDYESDIKYSSCGKYFYAVPDDRSYPDNLMINMPDFIVWVHDQGGLVRLEADYYNT